MYITHSNVHSITLKHLKWQEQEMTLDCRLTCSSFAANAADKRHMINRNNLPATLISTTACLQQQPVFAFIVSALREVFLSCLRFLRVHTYIHTYIHRPATFIYKKFSVLPFDKHAPLFFFFFSGFMRTFLFAVCDLILFLLLVFFFVLTEFSALFRTYRLP